jgi:hypothetical protein
MVDKTNVSELYQCNAYLGTRREKALSHLNKRFLRRTLLYYVFSLINRIKFNSILTVSLNSDTNIGNAFVYYS